MNALNPDSRELLVDALRPPSGARFDAGVGTSFTVDLESLLMTPLALARFDLDESKADPSAVLAAVQRHADKLAVFYDAAHLNAHESDRLFVLLENSLHAVSAPRGGAFHPKLWVLRYRESDGARTHRILVLSRNLTLDRSWDLLARLDEDAADGAPIGRSASMILNELDMLSPSAIARDVAATVRRARFQVPEPFEEAALVGMGFTDTYLDPLEGITGERVLVVSPFLAPPRLRAIHARARKHELVSRGDELERLGQSGVDGWGVPRILMTPEPEDDDGGDEKLRGLHAKLIVVDHGTSATWILGSANATAAAIDMNTEVVLRLVGRKSRIGTRKLLEQPDNEVTFASLLRDFPIENADPLAKTPDELEAERLERLVVHLARQPASLDVATDGDGYLAALRFGGTPPELEPGDRIRARLVTRTGWTGVELGQTVAAHLPAAKASELTALVQVEIKCRRPSVRPQRCVLVAELIGAPPSRLDDLFYELISTPSAFVRMLFLLIAADDPTAAESQTVRRVIDQDSSLTAAQMLGIPLYEALVRASSRDPELIRSIDDLVRRLETTERGRALLPSGFLESWDAFRSLVPAVR